MRIDRCSNDVNKEDNTGYVRRVQRSRVAEAVGSLARGAMSSIDRGDGLSSVLLAFLNVRHGGRK